MPDAPERPALRRRLLLARMALLSPWTVLAARASTWPPVPPGSGSSSASQRLRESADAHGAGAWAALGDVSLAVDRLWTPAGGLAGPAQVRWRPGDGVMAAQSGAGASRMASWRRLGSASEPAGARVWRDGVVIDDSAAADGAARQADLLRLLWLGPVAVAQEPGVVNWAEPETLDGRRCDHLHLRLAPGLGGASAERLSLFIDREEGWLRRLRVSLGGADETSQVAEVDLGGYQRLHGVLWPTRCQPEPPGRFGTSPPPWRLTGLDVNRGYPADAIAGPDWGAPASASARPLPGV